MGPTKLLSPGRVSAILIVACLLGSLAAGVSAAQAGGSTPSTPSALPAPGASASSDASTVGSASLASPHPGVLDIYEIAPAGAETEDPAVAYDTVSYEPILNVYETLVSYNGSSTATFVPTLATCVPGTTQCVTDYGTNFTTNASVGGVPTAWTFAIDPAARFYNPATGGSWPVYPSDVVFSVARTLAFADLPYAGKSPGWILAQALLPNGNATWDHGIHYPYNNTPQQILGSMRVNDSSYCPAAAMNGVTGNGCVTFLATGGGQSWPYFLDLVADNLGASVVPCGWFTYQNAGIPGWAGSHAEGGDGSCYLPDGGTTTNDSAWSTYLASVSPTAWDSFENLSISPGWPAPQPNVQWNMVGSGPYSAAVTPGTGYQLSRSPAYAEPSGCSGAAGLAVYRGGCDPAPSSYVPTVNVYYEPDDSFVISQFGLGKADFGQIEAVHASTMESLEHSGKIQLVEFPTLVSFFSPIDMNFNESAYIVQDPTEPVQTIPQSAFTNIGLRNLLTDAYPYSQIERTVNTVDGIPFSFNSGGPIPAGMSEFYPENITFPFELNGGVPDANASAVGGAAWWWSELTNLSSPYYDPQLSSCSASTPCTFTLFYDSDITGGEKVADDWAGELSNLTAGAIQMNPAVQEICFGCLEEGPGFEPENYSITPTTIGDGWGPDYPDPSDFTQPIISSHGAYTLPDSVEAQLTTAATDNATACGHAAVSWANLLYWAHASEASNLTSGTLNESCEGVAYGVMNGYLTIEANGTSTSAQRVLAYNLIEQISNALALNVYDGQDNAIVSIAPWINPSSVNTNPMIGGGGDELWFNVHYLSAETEVTFKETGLPVGSNWSVTEGSPPQTRTNVTGVHGGSISVFAPNGTFNYSFTGPAGFGAGRVTGPGLPTFGALDVTYNARGVTLTVHFGPLEPVTFTEVVSASWPGLSSGALWSITLTPTNPDGAPGGSNATAGGSVGFRVPAGASYHFQVGKPSTDHASGGHGSFTVPTHAITKTVKFAPFTSAVTFSEAGLPSRTGWAVVITGPEDLTLSGTTAGLTTHLINGTYSFSIAAIGARSPTPASGMFTVGAPTALHERIDFSDPFGPAQRSTAVVPGQGSAAGSSPYSAPIVASRLRS